MRDVRQQSVSSLYLCICVSELAIVRAAVCALSDVDGLLITMAVISSEWVSQSFSSLPPCTKSSTGFFFSRDNELSQLTGGCTERPRARAGRAVGMHSQERKG